MSLRPRRRSTRPSLTPQVIDTLPERYTYCARSSDRRIAGANGLGLYGTPLSTASMFPAFCAGKPLIGHALAAYLEAAGFGPNDPVMIDECERDFTIIDLLNHQAKLPDDPRIFQAGFAVAPHRRDSLVRHALEHELRQAGYSEWLGLRILEMMTSQLTRQSPLDLAARIEADWRHDGVASGLSFSTHAADETYWGVQQAASPIPCVSLAVTDFGPTEVSLNLRCSAEGLVNWYQTYVERTQRGVGLLRAMPSSRWLAEAASSDSEPAFDQRLGRVTGYRTGLQTRLGGGYEHLASATMQCHPGWMGSIAAWHDTSTGETVAIIAPEIDFRHPPSQDTRRQALAFHVVSEVQAK